MVLEVAPRGLSSPALGELGRLSSPSSRSASPSLARRPPTAARPQRASLETGTSNLQRTSLGSAPHHVRRHTVATSAFAADVAFLQADYAFQAGAEVTLESRLHHTTKGTARQLFASETAPAVELSTKRGLSTVYSGITWDAPRPLSHPVHITPTVSSTEFSLGGDGSRELEALAVTAFTMQQEAAQQEALQPSIKVVQEQVSSGAKMAAATRSVHMVRGTSDLLNAVDRYAEWARRARRKNRAEGIQVVLNALGSKPALVGSSKGNTLRLPHTLQSLDSFGQPSRLNDAGTPAPPAALSVGTA